LDGNGIEKVMDEMMQLKKHKQDSHKACKAIGK